MRKLILFVALLAPLLSDAQPAGYYATADHLEGQALRVALMNIIRAHTELTYTPGLWNAYYTTDKKPNGKVWDMYSDVPGGTPAYEYSLGTNQCGSVSPTAEGSCYNREHTWPQSKFGSSSPMQTDLFIVYPSDYFVNSERGNLPYGKVGVTTRTFTNNSKLGSNIYAGAPTGNCYEPIDSFKGDLARTYFYISTCYRNDSAKFVSWEMATQVNLKPWAVQMLLEWHHNDPVSKKETDRNNAVYALQNNRNPFIDHPEYADCIWGNGNCPRLGISTIEDKSSRFTLFPNPAENEVTLAMAPAHQNGRREFRLYSMTGAIVSAHVIDNNTDKLTIAISGLPSGLYLAQLITNTGAENQKLLIR